MKKILLAVILLSTIQTNAQFSFSDDFESYSVGDYLGEADTLWTTWSGTTGGNEDVKVSADTASSGTNSIYLSSTESNGGPQDLLLPFGEVYTQGDFSFSANFFVNSGTGGYFNFQAETTPGNTWSVDCNMNNDGSIVLSTGGGATTFLTTSYPFDTWFDLELKVNLTLNQWELFIDNSSQGSFSNTINEIAALNLYPINGSEYFIDDIEVSHQPFNPVGLNALLSELTIPTYTQTPATIDISGSVLNYGADTITSMDIVWTDGTNTYTDNLTGLSIATLENYDFTHDDQLSMPNPDTANLTITIDNINGGQDIDDSNNSKSTIVYNVEFVTQRIPLYEHFTSNTCGPCASFNPGFQTLLDANDVNNITDAKVNCIKYQVNWPGSGDQSYNADVQSRTAFYEVQSVPTAHIDGKLTSSSQAEIDAHRITPSFLDITASAVATEGTELNVIATVKSYADYPNTKIHIAIVEDKYSNTAGSNGETEFFQVLRKMLPSANGTAADLSYGNTSNISESTTVAVGNVTQDSYRIWEDLGNCVVIIFVEDTEKKEVIHSKVIEITGNTDVTPSWTCETTGCIDPGTGNGEFTSLADCEEECVTDIEFWNSINFQLTPNPASEQVAFSFNAYSQNVNVSIYSMTGQLVDEFKYGKLEGQYTIPMNISSLKAGIYTVKIQMNNETAVHQLMKQ